MFNFQKLKSQKSQRRGSKPPIIKDMSSKELIATPKAGKKNFKEYKHESLKSENTDHIPIPYPQRKIGYIEN